VPACQDRGEDTLDDLVLADDPLGDLAAEPGNGTDQSLELAYIVLGNGLRCGHARLGLTGVCNIIREAVAGASIPA